MAPSFVFTENYALYQIVGMYNVIKAFNGRNNKRQKFTIPSQESVFENREATGLKQSINIKWRNMFMKSAHIV